jgi:hypothetical protein
MLEAMDMKDLPQLVTMAVRTKDRQSKDTEELLKWLKDLNPGFYMDNWRVLDNFWKNTSTETKGVILGVHYGSKADNHLYYHSIVVHSQIQN